MKKLIWFLLVIGCILSVSAYTDLDRLRYDQYQYSRYSQFPSYWERPYVPWTFPSFEPRYSYYPRAYYNPDEDQYYNTAYQSYYPRPFPILATGYAIQPDPGNYFPWQYYPDYYARQYYDLDDGEILLKGSSALPSTVRIKVGDTVTWQSKEGYPHVIKSTRSSAESFDSGSLIFGESFSRQFNEEGTYDYYDPLYPWLRGRVIVSPS